MRFFFGAGGLAIVFIGLNTLIQTLRRGTFRARGNRVIARSNHPIMFFANAAGIGILTVIGFGFIVWAVHMN